MCIRDSTNRNSGGASSFRSCFGDSEDAKRRWMYAPMRVLTCTKSYRDRRAEKSYPISTSQRRCRQMSLTPSCRSSGSVFAALVITSSPLIQNSQKREGTRNMDSDLCVLCSKEIIGYGNNAQPLKDGRCCDDCNHIAVVVRLLDSYVQQRKAE